MLWSMLLSRLHSSNCKGNEIHHYKRKNQLSTIKLDTAQKKTLLINCNATVRLREAIRQRRYCRRLTRRPRHIPQQRRIRVFGNVKMTGAIDHQTHCVAGVVENDVRRYNAAVANIEHLQLVGLHCNHFVWRSCRIKVQTHHVCFGVGCDLSHNLAGVDVDLLNHKKLL
jgi:hypothetical protein